MKVKITKEGTDGESESDIEIDIENDANDNQPQPFHTNKIHQEMNENVNSTSNLQVVNVPDQQTVNLSECSDSIKEQLTSLELPKEELFLDPVSISELEKVINSEFFEGRAAKTPSRYLKVSGSE